MNLKGLVGQHLTAILAAMAGGAVAGGGIVLAFTASPQHSPTTNAPVAAVAADVSPSPSDLPSDSPSPSADAPSPSPVPVASPTTQPVAPAPVAPAPAPAPAPTCAVGTVVLAESGTARWDGSFSVSTLCSHYTYQWSFGPVPADCATWTIGFYADVNDGGHEYTQAGPTSGSGSQVLANPGTKIQGEVNIYNGCTTIPWTFKIMTAK